MASSTDSNDKAPLKDYSGPFSFFDIQLDELPEKKPSKVVPPLQEDVYTSRKLSMDYFTVDGVILRTGYRNKKDWYLLPIREMLDNAIDFLWKNYKGDNASISVDITKDDKLFRIKVRNTSYKNIPVFSNLKPIFIYDMRYGSKQDVHIISRGMLGDAMKQILSLGYVLLHTSDDGTAFTDIQWEYPLIIRHNKREYEIYLNVDKAEQIGHVRIDESPKELASVDTEIELVLPVIDEVRNSLDRNYIEQFCRKYSLFTTDISFKFRIIDDSNYTSTTTVNNNDMVSELITALSTTPQKGILNIDVPALHPISAEWKNGDSIHSFTPEEFKRRIVNVHDKDSKSVYSVLINFIEGSQIKKTPENEISIAELLSKPDKYKRIEAFFFQLKHIWGAQSELSLPYTTNTKERKEALVARIAKLYDIDEKQEPVYKLIRDVYDNGVIQYPYAFEILAIPIKDPYGLEEKLEEPKQHEFIGAVNYSVSPKNNIFEGEYYSVGGHQDIFTVLKLYNFREYGASKNKLPCIIFGNLITPRRDPVGYDKSIIDIQPFAETIISAVKKIAPDIKTYRSVGYTFSGRDAKDVRRHDVNRKVSARAQFIKFLQNEIGLPSKDKYGKELI